MEWRSEHMGIDKVSLIKVLDFLPYPFLLSEYRDGYQHNIFVNKKFINEIGYTCEDIPTINEWFEMGYPDPVYRAQIMFDWRALVTKAKELRKDSVVIQAKIQTKKNGVKWYEVKASVLEHIHFVAFVNIDDEIKKELELASLNENKNRTLSILSHDLRSPLNNLLSVIELAAGNNLTETERNHLLSKISVQVHQMTDFLDTTLQWSKVNFAEIKLTNEKVVINPIVKKLIEVYQRSIDEKRINITTSLNDELSLWSDKEIISIVTRNILSNAIKYTPIGGWIQISGDTKGDRLIFTIENSGRGISAEKIKMIKSKNVSSERGTQGEKGLGLGLRLCQHLLETIGGTLEIEDLASKIAVFRIIL
jgi:signal transduction histidine kinase